MTKSDECAEMVHYNSKLVKENNRSVYIAQ